MEYLTMEEAEGKFGKKGVANAVKHRHLR
jgi:hypothetical protein